jgi:hypothetical protein
MRVQRGIFEKQLHSRLDLFQRDVFKHGVVGLTVQISSGRDAVRVALKSKCLSVPSSKIPMCGFGAATTVNPPTVRAKNEYFVRRQFRYQSSCMEEEVVVCR